MELFHFLAPFGRIRIVSQQPRRELGITVRAGDGMGAQYQ